MIAGAPLILEALRRRDVKIPLFYGIGIGTGTLGRWTGTGTTWNLIVFGIDSATRINSANGISSITGIGSTPTDSDSNSIWHWIDSNFESILVKKSILSPELIQNLNRFNAKESILLKWFLLMESILLDWIDSNLESIPVKESILCEESIQ